MAVRIDIITTDTLRARKFESFIPEYYQLDNIIENNLWHDQQNVLDHVIGVFEGLESVLQFTDLKPELKKYLEAYLQEKIDRRTREEILKVATLLHDIAKNDTLVKNPDGTASCPQHELIGASRVKLFAARFDLGLKDEERVERIVRYHGFISEILNLMLATGNHEKYERLFEATVGDVAVDLVLLLHADLLGSDLAKKDWDGYEERIVLLQKMLQRKY